MNERYESINDISFQAELSQKQSNERRIENRRNRRIARRALRTALIAGGSAALYFGGGHIIDRNLDQMEREGRPPRSVATHIQEITPPSPQNAKMTSETPPLELPND